MFNRGTAYSFLTLFIKLLNIFKFFYSPNALLNFEPFSKVIFIFEGSSRSETSVSLIGSYLFISVYSVSGFTSIFYFDESSSITTSSLSFSLYFALGSAIISPLSEGEEDSFLLIEKVGLTMLRVSIFIKGESL